MVHPVHEAGELDGIVGRDFVEGKDDIVRVEGLAIVELDALAELQLKRRIVDPLPACRQVRKILASPRVAHYQSVPDHRGEPDTSPRRAVVVVGVDHDAVHAPSDPQCVVGLVRPGVAADGHCHGTRKDQYFSEIHFLPPCSGTSPAGPLSFGQLLGASVERNLRCQPCPIATRQLQLGNSTGPSHANPTSPTRHEFRRFSWILDAVSSCFLGLSTARSLCSADFAP